MVKGECVGECVCEGDRALDVEVICSKISIFGDNNNYTVLFKYVLITLFLRIWFNNITFLVFKFSYQVNNI